MAMLDRYKKSGGFNQLLTLLETCGLQKRQKFLEIIRQEDPRWASALVAKMIDLERFLKWNDSAIAEVTGSMMEINVAAIVTSLDEAQQARILGTLGHAKRRKVQEHIDTQKPSPGEIATSMNKLFETIRRLSQDGVLRLDKIDPDLFIDADIEDRLKQGKNIAGVPSLAEALAANLDELSKTPDSTSPHLRVVTALDSQAWEDADGSKDLKALQQEFTLLKKKFLVLQQENASLRQELSVAIGKLEQIKKIA
ncbi:MAG: FliG C-terminal domain-containing protein [Bdellovibrionales bacterium]|jgi:hypothetical protein|nr:FliG C-terminal domain-containing protein [Bdellovibrionales bacterium]